MPLPIPETCLFSVFGRDQEGGAMFRIRRLHDISVPIDREAVRQIQIILREQFPLIAQDDIDDLPGKLVDPLKYKLRTVLLVADDGRQKVKGFAIMNHAPDLNFSYLDYISVAPRGTGGGIGGALYERVQEEATILHAIGLFMECLPDDPALCSDQEILKQNESRLKFYERYNALPVINTRYETPLKEGGDCPPYLVIDPLNNEVLPSRKEIRKIVKAILNRKYPDNCPEDYVSMVVRSFNDDPVQCRPKRYMTSSKTEFKKKFLYPDKNIALIINEKHDIHHIRQRGYVEAPVRIPSILAGIETLDIFNPYPAKRFPDKLIKEVHDRDFYEYLKNMCSGMKEKDSVYPYVFPIRNQARPPKDKTVRAGYYCIDTFTPLNKNAFLAARNAVDCTLTAAEKLLEGYRRSYSLVRPPGHHAEKRSFGGFCYFNSAAIAAHYLSKLGKVAVLDIDYHHGNGTQDIFYERPDVLTLSIHGDPAFAYPYFSGFRDETGRGEGEGYNQNYPLQETCPYETYKLTLKKALKRVAGFAPQFLVVALGYDTSKNDPTGTWSLAPADFEENGRLISKLNLPTLIVQEGGYRSKSLAIHAKSFFQGLHGSQ